MAGFGQPEDERGSRDRSVDSGREVPAARPTSFATVEEALRRLDLSADDRAELLDRVAAMGRPDPAMNERVGADRLTLAEAQKRPLRRTPTASIPEAGEASSAFIETFYLPSARLIQLRRRFPSTEELARVLESASGFDQPALWIREIRLPDGLRELPSAVWIEAATVSNEAAD